MIRNKAIFFDRDGVLNKAIIKDKKPFPPNNIKELIIENFVEETIIFLKKLNYKVFIFTNQPDVSRKTIKKENALEINNFLKKKFDIDDVFMCFCSDNSKPRRSSRLCHKVKTNFTISWNM